MSAITPTPFSMKDCVVTIGTDSYEAAISTVQFVPTASTITFTAVSPGAVYTDVSPATWVCNLTFAQDWSDEDSLAYYLMDNEGETVEMTFKPTNTTGATITADVIITPGAIGGDVSAFAIASVSLGVVGKPTVTPPGLGGGS